MYSATLPRRAMVPVLSVPAWVLVALVPLALHLLLVVGGISPVVDGGLLDTDSYMRLTRVRDLATSGAWFDSVIHRSNAPYGDDLNWTRPLDVVLLLGALLQRPWFVFDDALFWTAAAIGPLGHLAVGFAAAWAFAPFVPATWRPVVAVAVFAQIALYFESLAGRADHHHLIFALAIIQAGLVGRMLRGTARAQHTAAAAGVAAALGIWVSVELLLPLALSMAALGIAWAADRVQARDGRTFAGALALSLGIAVMVERAPAAYGAIEYDKVSIVHVALAFALAALWTALAALDVQGRLSRGFFARLAACAGIAVACLAVFVGLFPRFLLGPTADVDPVVMDVFLNGTAEMRALWPAGLAGAGELAIHLGPVLVAIPGMVLLARRGTGIRQSGAWAYLGALALAYALLALAHQRFAPFAAVLAVPFAIHALVAIEARIPGAGAPFRYAAIVGAMLLPGLAGAALAAAAPAPGEAVPLRQRCDARDAARWMAANLAPGLVMAHLNQGPLLLYWTPHSVVSGPYHRNRAGIRDGFAFFASEDDRSAKRIVAERGVDYVLICPGEDRAAAKIERSLANRLEAGQPPSWLRTVALPGSRFMLYRVLR